tara:strand:- start:192 stop:410 length:219 start_codon:yes stop_codon:yes gene_type:complete
MSTVTAETKTYEGFPYLSLRRELLNQGFILDSDLHVHNDGHQVGHIVLSTRDCDVYAEVGTELDKFMKKRKK